MSVSRTAEQQRDSEELAKRGIMCDLGMLHELQSQSAKIKLQKFFENQRIRERAAMRGKCLFGASGDKFGILLKEFPESLLGIHAHQLQNHP